MGETALKPFQLDENCDSKILRRNCTAEGKCKARPFPPEYKNKGKKDSEWFPKLLSADAPIITADFTIALEQENVRAIPANPCGVLVIRPKTPVPGFGVKKMIPIISAFKERFPMWNQIDWSGVYAEITEVDINIRHLADASRTSGKTILLDEQNLSGKIEASLKDARSGRISLIKGGE